MNVTRAVAVVGVTTLAASAASACSGDRDVPEAGRRTARIYVITSQTGDDAVLGLGARNGVQLAARQAVADGFIPGWTLDVVSLDDKGDAATAATLAAKAAADDQAVAVVGSVSSGVTSGMLAALTQARLPTVSPTATNPVLARGDDFATAPARRYPFFYRVIPPDDAHAPAVAKYLGEKGVTSVATLSSGDNYGKVVVAAFTSAFAGKVTDQGTTAADLHDVTSVAARIAASGVQAVFFGGYDTQGAALSLEVKKAGAVIPLAGTDSLNTGEYIPQSGPISAGDISTMAGKPLAEVEAGRAFLAAYTKAGFLEPPTPATALGYDSARAVIAALRTSLAGASSPVAARAGTVAALSKVKFDGTGGPIAFDAYGEISPRTVTVETLQSGGWKAVKSYTF